MSVADPRQAESVIYPETDGRPMGETDLHIHWMIRIRDLLKHRYRASRTYVASNLLVYYDEGVPRNFVVPDVFVVLDCDTGFRRTYKIWEERLPPQVVFEVTSASTRREDEVWKPRQYAQIGVQEYFLYDPTGEYLRPALKGFQQAHVGFEPIVPNAEGRLTSEILGISLELQDADLVFRDVADNAILQTGQEAAEQRAAVAQQTAKAARKTAKAARKTAKAARKTAKAAQQSAKAAQQSAKAAQQRNAELEAEIQRLRERLGE